MLGQNAMSITDDICVNLHVRKKTYFTSMVTIISVRCHQKATSYQSNTNNTICTICYLIIM